ncbi:MAG TPA: hypothetical protein DDW81_11285 [Cryomorphaceae bacterium]|nr:hypothetical protein [Owenweeksia sp.]HBF20674.1 hypothetical protein [Cryomorphaceae bacterium]HCQ16586.1 hypothetical protein [Cryomorphaceae bacterium]|tara:strand:+ start:979 stop:1299 length:321 start_codon:yes stop_codon:yes gene_type:complete
MKRVFLGLTKRQLAIITFIVLGLIFFYLLYLPADHFDHGEPVCVSTVLFDTECYGCGMTRAIQHLLHADFTEAWKYNKLSFIVLPLAIYMIATSLLKATKEKNQES